MNSIRLMTTIIAIIEIALMMAVIVVATADKSVGIDVISTTTTIPTTTTTTTTTRRTRTRTTPTTMTTKTTTTSTNGVINGKKSDKRIVMPWMCLERCGDGKEEIARQVKQILEHKDIISAVSFELFNIGANSTLIENDNLTHVGKLLANEGLELYAMISSYPYPPELMDWLRSLFQNPEPFFHQCQDAFNRYPFLTGLNVDFEPEKGATSQDALLYARFLQQFGDFMNRMNKKLTVDMAEWSPLWDFDALSKVSSVHYFMNMGTYTGNLTLFSNRIQKTIEIFGSDRAGIGMMTTNPTTQQPYTDKELKQRFDLLALYKAKQIDIWKMDIPQNWWQFLHNFVSTSHSHE